MGVDGGLPPMCPSSGSDMTRSVTAAS